VINEKKNEIRLNGGLMATQGPLFSDFSAPLGCPSTRVFYALSHASHNDISKNKGINFILNRI